MVEGSERIALVLTETLRPAPKRPLFVIPCRHDDCEASRFSETEDDDYLCPTHRPLGIRYPEGWQ